MDKVISITAIEIILIGFIAGLGAMAVIKFYQCVLQKVF